MRLSALHGVLALALLAACATELKPPTADAGADRTVAVGQVVQLDGAASQDPQGLPISFAWSFRVLPVGSAARFNDPAAVTPSFTADVAGRYLVDLSVTSGAGRSSTATVVINADVTAGVVAPIAGFTVSPVALGPGALLAGPRGLVTDGLGTVYVAEAASTPPRLTRLQAGVASVVAQRGYLGTPVDLAWRAGALLATNGGARIVQVTPAGMQTAVVDTTFTTDLRFFGVTATPSGAAYAVAEAQNRAALQLDPATWTTSSGSGFGGNLGTPWGVALDTSSGTDVWFGGSGAEIWRSAGGAAVRVARSGLLGTNRKLLVTACTPTRLLVAAAGTGSVVVLDTACSTADCANGSARALVTGLGAPTGLAWDGADLLVSDETGNAIYRVRGNFCSL